jgi:hypothetical protein
VSKKLIGNSQGFARIVETKNGHAMSWYQYQQEKLILNLIIQLGSKQTEIVGLHGDHLKIRLQISGL